MKKISIEAARALTERKNFRKSNTEVKVDNSGNAHLYLFGNRIAVNTAGNDFFITTAGWWTRTTFDRLGALPLVSIRKNRNRLTISGAQWDGDWILIAAIFPVLITNKQNPPSYDWRN